MSAFTDVKSRVTVLAGADLLQFAYSLLQEQEQG
jgi:hypothetical protein